MKHHIVLYIITILGLVAISSCESNRQQKKITGMQDLSHGDSIVFAESDDNDKAHTLAIIDSLYQAGELSKAKTIFYSTVTYNLRGEYRSSMDLYYQLADINVNELAGTDLECYIYSCNNYLRVLCEMRRYDAALREAYSIDAKLKAAGYDSFASHHDVAQIIGDCQLNLGQTAEATKSYQKSLQGVHTRLATFKDPIDFRECQNTMKAITMAYIHLGRYAEAVPWVERQDSLYAIAITQPNRDSVHVDEMKADISYCKALLAHAQGDMDLAESSFKDYLSTNTSKRISNIINGTQYLMKTRRYVEAADNYRLLDQFMRESAFEVSLENIGRYLMPKFRANLQAGRTDTALSVARQIAEAYDSALIQQKKSVAAEVATIYDIQGKERQIVEQREKLSQQRLLSAGVVLLLFIIFFIIYTLHRRKAYKKLDEINHQLVIANQRAEESSKMKAKFIQQISHEVRTPLNILSGFSQVLATPDMLLSKDELNVISQKIMENSTRITDLVDKMLDLSASASDTAISCNDTVKPLEIANLAVVKSAIKEAPHLDFDLLMSPLAEAMTFVTNKESAIKVLSLLLDNARKFTRPAESSDLVVIDHKEHVTLRVDIIQQQVCFVVEDTGISIPPEEAENIFQEFVQLDDYYDGTGIGLSIARSLARQMGGDIILDSTYTQGARFLMKLPIDK